MTARVVDICYLEGTERRESNCFGGIKSEAKRSRLGGDSGFDALVPLQPQVTRYDLVWQLAFDRGGELRAVALFCWRR